jgi:SET domain-containing protein
VKKGKRRFSARRSGIHGRGVFALTPIARGERIMEYTGERMSHAEADRRYGNAHDGSAHTMLMAVDDKVVIDATRRGGSARWINHSCAPNCEAVEEDGRVFIDARRAIKVGEELGYDYELIVDDGHTARVKREHACCCGAKTCRGTMVAPPKKRKPRR